MCFYHRQLTIACTDVFFGGNLAGYESPSSRRAVGQAPTNAHTVAPFCRAALQTQTPLSQRPGTHGFPPDRWFRLASSDSVVLSLHHLRPQDTEHPVGGQAGKRSSRHLPTASMPCSRSPDISRQMLFSMSRPVIL